MLVIGMIVVLAGIETGIADDIPVICECVSLKKVVQGGFKDFHVRIVFGFHRIKRVLASTKESQNSI
jgi:hypothetical protein